MPSRFIVAVENYFGTTSPIEIKLDGAHICEFFRGDRNIYLFGRVDYAGTTKLPHVSRFAYLIMFNGGDATDRYYPDGPDAYWENS